MTQPAGPHNAAAGPENHADLPRALDGVTTPVDPTTTLTRADVLTSTNLENTTGGSSTEIPEGVQNLTQNQLGDVQTTSLRGGRISICLPLVFPGEALKVHQKFLLNLRLSQLRRHH